MDNKKVLSIQDISCLGQCSLTVALPIISACGVETCVLPSALLSTHTLGFEGYTCMDLTDEMNKILAHWNRHNLKFDVIGSGYLGSLEQINVVKQAFASCLKDGGARIVDPVMGDGGKLYPAFDGDFVAAMRTLCAEADYILPNITEASLLLGEEYKEEYDEKYIMSLLDGLVKLGAKNVVLTGVGYRPDKTGVAVYNGKDYFYYPHRRVARSCHGTGDIFSSVFAGALVKGKSASEAVCIAADYIVRCIENTPPSHWYGVRFEECIPYLISRLD